MVIANGKILELLREVKDPEVPILDVVELGIVRSIAMTGGRVRVDITPTYSGCPALNMIEQDILATLKSHGYEDVEVKTIYSPAWTTDWLSAETKEKLRAAGIAPPHTVAAEPLVMLERARSIVTCPFCGSAATVEKSEFGSTACKAIHYCNACHQPFDHFKSF